MDIFEPAERSAIMSRIRSVETTPEVRLRKALFARGFRYRKNVRNLPGTPDIVLAKHRYAIQVRGCFWHAHDNCNRASVPSTNSAYWLPKLAQNVARDKVSDRALRKLGWHVRVIWECAILSRSKLENVADRLAREINASV